MPYYQSKAYFKSIFKRLFEFLPPLLQKPEGKHDHLSSCVNSSDTDHSYLLNFHPVQKPLSRSFFLLMQIPDRASTQFIDLHYEPVFKLLSKYRSVLLYPLPGNCLSSCMKKEGKSGLLVSLENHNQSLNIILPVSQ